MFLNHDQGTATLEVQLQESKKWDSYNFI